MRRAADLRRLGELRWVYLQVTDAAHVETAGAQDPETRARLRDDLAPYPTSLGPHVLGHSHLGMSVLGSEDDAERIAAVFAALWPQRDMARDGSGATAYGRMCYRDALGVATAIRYHGSGFVTEDRKVLGASEAVRERFGGFRLVSVADATSESIATAQRVRRTAAVTGKPDPATLPDWP